MQRHSGNRTEECKMQKTEYSYKTSIHNRKQQALVMKHKMYMQMKDYPQAMKVMEEIEALNAQAEQDLEELMNQKKKASDRDMQDEVIETLLGVGALDDDEEEEVQVINSAAPPDDDDDDDDNDDCMS